MAVVTKVETQLVGGGEKIAELPAEIITYGERLNRAGPISFELAVGHPTCTRDVVGPGLHEVVVTRNRQVVWCGPVLTADEPPKPDSGPWLMSFGGEGLAYYFKRMHVTSDVGQQSALDQFTIVKNLVDHHQNKAGGDFGIDTTQITTSGVTREGLLYRGVELKNIGEALEQLADRDNGFDFDVEPSSRELRLHYPRKGSRKADLVWDERTIRSFQRGIDSTAQASQMLGVGSTQGTTPVRASLQDAGAVSSYGLTQAIYSNNDVLVLATLQDHIRRELALFKKPAEMVAVTVDTDEPEVFSYQVGDEGRLRWPSSYDPVNRFMRLVGRDIVWQAGEEQAVLYLEEIA